MQDHITFEKTFNIKGGDFVKAGEASIKIKNILKEIGVKPVIIRRIAIAAYEAEMNVVMYAQRGVMKLTVTPEKILLNVKDKGQGIENIELAMQPGFSTATTEMREKGFGAGMGLPNIKKNTDNLNIKSVIMKGTKLEMVFQMNGNNV